MSRGDAIECAATYFDDGDFFKDLERRVAIKTESQIFETRKNEMSEYMEEMHQTLAPLGFDTKVFENPNPKAGPIFFAERIEDKKFKTVLTYGHGDVVRGQEENGYNI